jgi:hypothetical protein
MSDARSSHEALLVALHQEMKAGRRNGERANAIGDEMNELWAALDDEERELFDELSEDLYLIEGKRRVVPLDEGETIASVRRQLAIAVDARRDRDALTLVRKVSDVRPELTDLIGRCWERLGFPLGAKCFRDFAWAQMAVLRFKRATRTAPPTRASGDDSDALRPAA